MSFSLARDHVVGRRHMFSYKRFPNKLKPRAGSGGRHHAFDDGLDKIEAKHLHVF